MMGPMLAAVAADRSPSWTGGWAGTYVRGDPPGGRGGRAAAERYRRHRRGDSGDDGHSGGHHSRPAELEAVAKRAGARPRPGSFQIPTAFQNDANAAAFGEFWAGAGKDMHSMVLFTLGTGVGGGIIIGELVIEGEHSHGAELGHTKIEMTNPRQCGCGRWGCLEAMPCHRRRQALKGGPSRPGVQSRLQA